MDGALLVGGLDCHVHLGKKKKKKKKKEKGVFGCQEYFQWE